MAIKERHFFQDPPQQVADGANSQLIDLISAQSAILYLTGGTLATNVEIEASPDGANWFPIHVFEGGAWVKLPVVALGPNNDKQAIHLTYAVPAKLRLSPTGDSLTYSVEGIRGID